MTENYRNFSEIPKERFPFPIYRANDLPFKELTLRTNDAKWPTVRFFVESRGKKFRIKEFFMDWFFTGFPKSLFKDFSSSYSEVKDLVIDHTVFYYGKNYHGLDSVSGFRFGTQLEVECKISASPEDFIEVIEDLLETRPEISHLRGKQFPDRSHSAKGYESDWYENKRVSRLNWYRTGMKEFIFSGHRMTTSGIGTMAVEDKSHTILILEENGFESAIWAEKTDRDIEISNATYNFRKGTGFYNSFKQTPEGKLLFREPNGPGILRVEMDQVVWTVGFSPGFSIDEIRAFSEMISIFSNFFDNALRNAIHEKA